MGAAVNMKMNVILMPSATEMENASISEDLLFQGNSASAILASTG